MSTLRCWSIRNILDLYVDHRLGPGWTSRVEAHLPACPGCRRAAQEMGALPSRLKAALSVAVPEGLAGSILKELASRKPSGWSVPDLGWAWRLTPNQAAALAYCALLALGHALPGPHPQDPTPQLAVEEIEP